MLHEQLNIHQMLINTRNFGRTIEAKLTEPFVDGDGQIT